VRVVSGAAGVVAIVRPGDVEELAVGVGVVKSLSDSESCSENDSYSSEFSRGEGGETVGSVDF